MVTMETREDSTRFGAEMKRLGADAIIVMGGDGTSRAVAKGTGNRVPTISLSTGTNNVYPEMLEGTIVGLAASAIANKAVATEECTCFAKQIEIERNGKPEDIALVDMVFCRNPFVGSRAIWRYDEIDSIVVTQCHMATIGFSALVGAGLTIEREDEFGGMATFSDEAPNTFSPMGAGTVRRIHIKDRECLELNRKFSRIMDYHGTLALDGEREVVFHPGDTISFAITRNGPCRVDVRKTVENARRNGFFAL
jgi:NAD kinase